MCRRRAIHRHGVRGGTNPVAGDRRLPDGPGSLCRYRCEEALTILRATGDKWVRGMGLNYIAGLRVLQGLYEQATQLSREVLPLWQELGERRSAAWCFENLAAAAADLSQADRAARLWGASDALLESVGSPLPPTYQQIRDRYLITVRDSMGETAFQVAFSEGRALSLTQAVEYALGVQ